VYFSFVRRLITSFGPFRLKIGIAFVGMLIEQVFDLSTPYLAGMALTALLTGMASPALAANAFTQSVMWLTLAFALGLVDRFFTWRRAHMTTRVSYEITTHFSRSTLERVTLLSVGQFRSFNSGQVQMIVRKGEDSLWQLVTSFLFQVTPILLQIVGSALALLFIDFRLGTCALVTVSIAFALVLSGNYFYSKPINEEQGRETRLGRDYSEFVRNMPLVLSHGRQQELVEDYMGQRQELDTFGMNLWRSFMGLSEFRTYLLWCATFGIRVYTFWLVAHRQLPVGMLIPVMSWLGGMTNNLGTLMSRQRQILNHLTSVRRYFKLLDTEPAVTVSANPIRPPAFAGEVRLVDVSFSYPVRGEVEDEEIAGDTTIVRQTKMVLQGVNVTIPAGTMAAFV